MTQPDFQDDNTSFNFIAIVCNSNSKFQNIEPSNNTIEKDLV